jgi:hypothetical protein
MEARDEFNKQFLKNLQDIKHLLQGQSIFNAYSILTSLSAEFAIRGRISLKNYLEDCEKIYSLMNKYSMDKYSDD